MLVLDDITLGRGTDGEGVGTWFGWLHFFHFKLTKEQQTSCPHGVSANWKTPSHIQGSEGALKNNFKSVFETQKCKITKLQDKIAVLK